MRHKTVDLTKNTCPLKEKMCETLPKRFRDNATSKLCLGIELIMSHLYATSTSNMWKSGLGQKSEQF